MKPSEITKRPLADKTVAALEAEPKAYRERDGDGLYLYVMPTGKKRWELRYRKPDGKYSWLGMGTYPEVKAKEAREKAREARQLVAQGTTPRQHQQEQEAAEKATRGDTIEALMLEWKAHKEKKMTPAGLRKLWLMIEKHLLPHLGKMPITELTPAKSLEFLRMLEKRGIHETGAKLRRALAEAFDMAAFSDRVKANPVRGAERFVETPKSKNYEHVSQEELPALVRAMDGYPHSGQVRTAMLLLVLNGCRPTELREARWDEIDLDNAVWEIPAERMKMRRPHSIPLAPISVQLLREQRERAGGSHYVFPNRNDPRKPMSNMTINKGIERIGYKGRQTGHGFRHVLSTGLHERGYQHAHIEAQLAHAERGVSGVSGVSGVYNKAVYIEPRRQMMDAWAQEIQAMMDHRENVVAIKTG